MQVTQTKPDVAKSVKWVKYRGNIPERWAEDGGFAVEAGQNACQQGARAASTVHRHGGAHPQKEGRRHARRSAMWHPRKEGHGSIKEHTRIYRQQPTIPSINYRLIL